MSANQMGPDLYRACVEFERKHPPVAVPWGPDPWAIDMEEPPFGWWPPLPGERDEDGELVEGDAA